MIDFSNLRTTKKGYNGANGGKKCVVYNDEKYLLKIPPATKMHISISEYLGCHIFNAIGIKAQDTLLGTYRINGEERIVVACKDFVVGGKKLLDFTSIRNQVIDPKHCGYDTELSDIEECIDVQTSFDAAVLKRFFWDIFIVDALIGNWDRHNGNWGFLYDEDNDSLEIAPIFDCGLSLQQVDEDAIQSFLNNPDDMELIIPKITYSAIKIDGKNIHYQNFITSLQNKDCNAALLRMFTKISMTTINEIINSMEYISDLQKQYFSIMLSQRYEKILKVAYKKLTEN